MFIRHVQFLHRLYRLVFFGFDNMLIRESHHASTVDQDSSSSILKNV